MRLSVHNLLYMRCTCYVVSCTPLEIIGFACSAGIWRLSLRADCLSEDKQPHIRNMKRGLLTWNDSTVVQHVGMQFISRAELHPFQGKHPLERRCGRNINSLALVGWGKLTHATNAVDNSTERRVRSRRWWDHVTVQNRSSASCVSAGQDKLVNGVCEHGKAEGVQACL